MRAGAQERPRCPRDLPSPLGGASTAVVRGRPPWWEVEGRGGGRPVTQRSAVAWEIRAAAVGDSVVPDDLYL